MKNVVTWFEIPVVDFNRAVKFYNNILGVELQTQEFGVHKMGFFPVEQGGISGAIVNGVDYEPSKTGPVIYLDGGEDLNNILSRVEDAGGKVTIPKKFISDEIGYFAHFLDSEGNMLGLFSQK
jgi:predicted enzyme related to lactoylglutathione lyase